MSPIGEGPPEWRTVSLTVEEGVGWIVLNRPDKRNAMNPEMNREMAELLDHCELDERCQVIVLTGAGESFTAGMDIREYFRETDGKSSIFRNRLYREAGDWQWRRLRTYPKPTIAMVNGWCFGGGFAPLVACDLAIADQDATFGLSEINWGIIPAGNVSKAVSTVIGAREALYYVMTGETFSGREAQRMGLVNEAVPTARLRERVSALAQILRGKNPTVMRQARISFKFVQDMDWECADDYLRAKQDQSRMLDAEKAREEGMKQFLDEKSFRPGMQSYRKPT